MKIKKKLQYAVFMFSQIIFLSDVNYVQLYGLCIRGFS